MKRLIIKAVSVVCFIAALGFASPADAKQRDVTPGTFTGIDVSDNFIVTVSRGTSFSVTLNVDDALDDYVTCHVRNQVLILALDEKKVPKDIKANYKGKNGFSPVLNAYVTVPDYIQSVTVSGKATFSDFGDVLGGVSVNVSVSDQGTIKHMAIANSQTVSIKTENRSNAVISVEAESVILDQGGSSVVDLTQTSTTCEISVLGSGSLVVTQILSQGRCQDDTQRFCTQGHLQLLRLHEYKCIQSQMRGGCRHDEWNLLPVRGCISEVVNQYVGKLIADICR